MQFGDLALGFPASRGLGTGITPAAPVNTTAPVVSGDTEVGSVLSVTNGTWAGYPPPTFTYQWRNATINIVGATASTYTTVAGDVGDAIDCVVTATNTAGSASQASSNSITVTEATVAPANTVLPAITGTEQVGEVLSVSDGTWTGTPAPTFTYQWTRDTVNIAGATANTHTLVEADEGTMIACVVTGTNSAGSDDATAAAVGPIIAAPPAGTDYPFSTARSSMYVPVLMGDI